LSPEERQQIVAVCNQAPYQSLPSSQIVPALADQGLYLAPEASFYRVLREVDHLRHRGKAQAPRQVVKPKGCRTALNQVWSWDITYLAITVAGLF
jgi:putative transposase